MIKNIFEKNIDRNIETVIKADDREHIYDEVAEYVITKEIAKKISDLFAQYNNYAGANGVWISGFFGSGKSHLLKILSYVLENKSFNGHNTGEIFAQKIENDQMLKADIIRASKIPSESILFNIDQQAQIKNKSDENAILSVFYKVFYDHLGFYGAMIHVAEFESWLSKEGKWEEFKNLYTQKFDVKWEDDRKKYFSPKIKNNFASVLEDIYGIDKKEYVNIIDIQRKDSSISIADFADKVNNYIKTKPANFRLNFFVDEVGQYISDNTKLMLNLQTIAETLATKTKGKSWVLVTSQEDMEKVVGDMNKQQQNDFSRIQARFELKVPLTSANVDEVIEKRLLRKNDDAQLQLVESYKKENAHLASLLSFSDAGVQFGMYASGDDFANKYPLVPYQFDLFQQCRKSLSVHNAFQGKHASVGERSMLGVFQQVILQIENKDCNALISFDLMYEGIRNELRGEIQNLVILAEKNLNDKFAVQVLKALFMVKYFANFKTTKRNISVLMINDICIDIKKHEKKVDLALNILESQSYVQRNGDIFEFLTDDEKDIEQEIKNTTIDEAAINSILKNIFFDDIVSDRKINYADNKQDYEFTAKLDGSSLGREKELEIEIITQNAKYYSDTTHIQAQTMGSNGMKMILSPDTMFMKDIRMYLRTEKYVKQNLTLGNSIERKRILQDKASINIERRNNIKIIANECLALSSVYMNGQKHEVPHANDGKTRLVAAFQDLVKIIYPNLRVLGKTIYNEDSIKKCLSSRVDDIFSGDNTPLSEPETEILNIIERRKKQADRTTLADLKTYFSRKPYGWYPNAIWYITAMLYKRGKIEIIQSSNRLTDKEVFKALMNSSNYDKVLIEAQVEYNQKDIRKLKETYKDAFDQACPYNEAKDVAIDFKSKLSEMASTVNLIINRKNEFHFLQSLENFRDSMYTLANNDYGYFLSNRADFEDNILDNKEDLLDPILRFINGNQAKIYKELKTIIESNNANLSYIEGDEVETIKAVIKSNTPYKGDTMQRAKAAKDSLNEKVLFAIAYEKESFNEIVSAIEKAIIESEQYAKITADQQDIVKNNIESLKAKVKNQRFIGNIKDITRNVEEDLYSQQMNIMAKYLAPKAPAKKEIIPGQEKQTDEVPKEEKPITPIAKYIKRTSIRVAFKKYELSTPQEVEEYLEEVKKAYLERIAQNIKITL